MTGRGGRWQVPNGGRPPGVPSVWRAGLRGLADGWPVNGRRRDIDIDGERRVVQAWSRQFEPVDDSPAAQEAADEALLRAVAYLLDPLQGRPVPPLGLDRAHFLGIARRVRAEEVARRRRHVRRCQTSLAAVIVVGVAAAAGQPAPGGAPLLGLVPPARITVRDPAAPGRGDRPGADGPDGSVL